MSDTTPKLTREKLTLKPRDSLTLGGSGLNLSRHQLHLPAVEGETEEGTTEEAHSAFVSELSAGFSARAKAEAKRRAEADDGNYYFVVYFHSPEQQREFLDAVGWRSLGKLYIDGVDLAQQLGITLTPRTTLAHHDKPDPALSELALGDDS